MSLEENKSHYLRCVSPYAKRVYSDIQYQKIQLSIQMLIPAAVSKDSIFWIFECKDCEMTWYLALVFKILEKEKYAWE